MERALGLFALWNINCMEDDYFNLVLTREASSN